MATKNEDNGKTNSHMVPKYINKCAFASFIKINFNTVSVCHHLRKMLITSILYLKISD